MTLISNRSGYTGASALAELRDELRNMQGNIEKLAAKIQATKDEPRADLTSATVEGLLSPVPATDALRVSQERGVPTAVVLQLISQTERQQLQTMLGQQAMQQAQALADAQRMFTLFLTRKQD